MKRFRDEATNVTRERELRTSGWLTFVAVSGCLREVRHQNSREQPERIRGRPDTQAATRLSGETFLPVTAASIRE